MNNTLLAIVLLFLTLCKSIAQEIDPGKPKNPSERSVQAGVKAGVNSSFFSASINSEASNKTGFHIGGYLRKSLSQNFSFRPEVYYSIQGQKDNYVIPTTGQSVGRTETTIECLNIPLLFEAGRKLNFQFGPQVGLLLSGHEKGTIDNERINDNLKSIMKAADLSVVVGIGYRPSKQIDLGARYNLGLTPIFQKPQNTPADFPTVANRVIHIYVGFIF